MYLSTKYSCPALIGTNCEYIIHGAIYSEADQCLTTYCETNTRTRLFTTHLFSRTSVETSVCSPAASTSGCLLTGSLSTRARLFDTVRPLGSTLGLFGLDVVGAFFIDKVFFLFFSFLPRATFDIFLPTAARRRLIKCGYATLRPHNSCCSSSRISGQQRCPYISFRRKSTVAINYSVERRHASPIIVTHR